MMAVRVGAREDHLHPRPRRERGRVIGRRRTEVGPEAEDARPHRKRRTETASVRCPCRLRGVPTPHRVRMTSAGSGPS